MAQLGHNDALAAAPPWFIPIYTQLKIDIAILQNQYRLEGGIAGLPLVEVLFPNGQRPTQPPHNLPLLESGAVVDALTHAQTNAYFDGYYPGVAPPNPYRVRRKRIKQAIGCPLE